MSVWLRLAVLAALLLSPLAAEANWFRGRNSGTGTTTTYYYPVTVYYVAPVVPVLAVPPVAYCPPPTMAIPAPAPMAAPRLFATPTPAPPTGATPSTTPPPATTPPPGIGESRSFYDAYAVAVREESSRQPERVTIGFWNHSSKDVVLTVDHESRTLARGQSLQLTLPRQFVWQVDERRPQNENVPAGQGGVDIVIRR
ncbi:MAG: hypothetical protein JNM56_32815 [Planctomycetia bacterium]|nr:hypothetical protein [Planctomycetia bacterium]